MSQTHRPSLKELQKWPLSRLKEYEEALKQELLSKARSDFRLFWNLCWPELPIAAHHIAWHNMLRGGEGVPPETGHDRVLIMAPRGWGKTSWIVRRILWELGHNRRQFITIVSADDDIAIAILGEIARNIEHNRVLRELFPLLQPGSTWQATRINVFREIASKDYSVKAAGLFSTGVSGRAHLLVFDDCVAWRTAQGMPSLREESKRIFHQVWMPQLLPDGRAVSLCTPWHIMDLNMELKRSGGWALWEQAALVDKEGRASVHGESTWPDVWSKEKLLRRFQEDEISFYTQYLLQPVSPTEQVFDLATIQACMVYDQPEEWATWPKYIGVDVGMRQDEVGSYSAIFVLAVDAETDTYWTCDILRLKAAAPDLADAVCEMIKLYRPVRCYVENNAFQQALVDYLEQRNLDCEIKGFTTTSNRNNSSIGVPALASRFRAGRWRIPHDHPEGIDACECAKCVWIRELAEWPNSRYTDTVMAMWLATRAAAADPAWAMSSSSVPNVIYGMVPREESKESRRLSAMERVCLLLREMED